VKVNVPVWAATGFEVPESNALPPSSLVTVWATDVTFFQVTVVPALIVMVAGLKVKVPLLSVVIMTTGALFAWVGGAAGVVAVVPDPVPVEPPPQAARSTSALSTSMHNDASLRCFRAGVIFIVIGLSISILFLLSKRLFVDLYRAFGLSRMVSRHPGQFQVSLIAYTGRGYTPQPLQLAGIVQIIFIAGLKFTIPGQKTLDFYKLY
jgi:hypothetical protein